MKQIFLITHFLLCAGLAGMAAWAAEMGSALPPAGETADRLNHLIERAIDGQKGFRQAAENAAAVSLKTRFTAASAERAKFVEELKAKIDALGQQPELKGSVLGSVHREWIDLSAALGSSDKDVLGAVKKGEETALQYYREALKTQMPEDVREIIAEQTKKIESSYAWVCQRIREQESKL